MPSPRDPVFVARVPLRSRGASRGIYRDPVYLVKEALVSYNIDKGASGALPPTLPAGIRWGANSICKPLLLVAVIASHSLHCCQPLMP